MCSCLLLEFNMKQPPVGTTHLHIYARFFYFYNRVHMQYVASGRYLHFSPVVMRLMEERSEEAA